MVKLRFFNNKKKKVWNTPIQSPIRSLRIKIVIMFFILLIILLIYDTYFETGNNSEENNKSIPNVVDFSSKNITFEKLDNKTNKLINPTLVQNSNSDYLLAFINLDDNGNTHLYLSLSEDGETWSVPIRLFVNLNNLTKPSLIFTKDEFFVLSIQKDNHRMISFSRNGDTWSQPEISELFSENRSIHYDKDFILMVKDHGLVVYDYDDLENTKFNSSGKFILNDQFGNGTILKINRKEFKILSEDPISNNNSLQIITIEIDDTDGTSSIIKWDLLIIFVIIGLIILVIIVREVARD